VGTLAIIATGRVEPAGCMDEVIFEKFKGTGTMEIILDRRISDRRVYPAMDINRSGTRREELLMDKETLNKIWILRKFLNEQSPQEAIEFLINQMGKTKTNKKFLEMMNT